MGTNICWNYLRMITLRYIFFALIATSLNLLFQYVSLLIYTDFLSLYVAMFMGTLVGLFSKYILDKNYIFYHTPKGKIDNFKKFIRYLIMGGITTLLFWGAEITFDLYFNHKHAKYLGAIIGLSAGYSVKYFLDKKYVFNENPENPLKITFHTAEIIISGVLVSLFIFVMINSAWLSDDSFISLTQIVNFHHGEGIVLNFEERVQAFTHPTWFFVISFITYVTGEYFYSIIFSSILLSMIAILIIFYYAYLNKKISAAIIGISLLVFSKSFVDYTTSGLENPLSYLLFSILIFFLLSKNSFSKNNLNLIYLLMVLIFLNRMDYALILLPITIYLFLEYKIKNIKPIIIAIFIVILWFLFSLFYFGKVFPNTYYAKIQTGYPSVEFIHQGLTYFIVQYEKEPMSLIIIFIGIIVGIIRKGSSFFIAIGLMLYLIYILRSGGGFMQGRFFSIPIFIAIFIVVEGLIRVELYVNHYISLVIILLITINSNSPVLVGKNYNNSISTQGIMDERGFYFQQYGLISPTKKWPKIVFLNTVKPINVGVTCGEIGAGVLSNRNKTHWVDKCALTDPLLSQLPAIDNNKWRAGHYVRKIPINYLKKISNKNVKLADKNLEELYSDIYFVTRGEIFNLDRVLTIYKINTHDYKINPTLYSEPSIKL